MSRAVELDGRLPQKEPETGFLGKDQAARVYRFEKQDMTVTLSFRGHQEAAVELALGTEERSFPLSEFIHFLLTMIEVGLKRDIAELESGEVLSRIRRKR